MSRILITDDSMLQRQALSAIVTNIGHEVDTACNGQEALEKIQAHKPDCLLLDILMPGMDGMEVLEQLKVRNMDIPVIVLTAEVQEWLKDRCLALGASAFLNKPLKQDQLRQALEKVFHPRRPKVSSCS